MCLFDLFLVTDEQTACRICPIGERIRQYEADEAYIDAVLADGAAKASELAAVTMADVKKAMGL